MKKIICLLLITLITSNITLRAGDSTFFDYQNYNHGYCPECNSYPCKCGGSSDVNSQEYYPEQQQPPFQPYTYDGYSEKEQDASNSSQCNTCSTNKCETSPSKNKCDSCADPCETKRPSIVAPIRGTDFGIAVAATGVVVVAVGIAAAILILAGQGNSSVHS